MTTLRVVVSASVLALANVMAAQTSLAPIPTDGATNFVATTKNQVVNVIQKGTGAAIVGFAPTGSGVTGQTQGTAGSVAILGSATGTGPGTATGVRGNSIPDDGIGVVGSATGANGIGVWGQTTGSGGLGGYFDNISGGNILVGAVNGAHMFRVDGTGKGFFDGGTQVGGADFAERVAVAPTLDAYEPGEVLAVDPAGKRQLKLVSKPYSTLVAGIYSTKPGVLATTRSIREASLASEVPLAIVGIVPCKVTSENGAIKPGDLLVSSSTPGYAMKGSDRRKMIGAVVGKALEPLAGKRGVIDVLVTLQ